MKKIVYSSFTKFIAVLIFIASIVFGSLIVSNGIAKYCNEKEPVYGFESSFSESGHLSGLLIAPENAVFNVYYTFYHDDRHETERSKTPLIINGQTLEQNIGQRLNDLYCAEKINYYVKCGDKVFTNCEATSENDLMSAQFYRLTTRDEKGNTQLKSSQYRYYSYPLLDELSRYGESTPVIVCTSVKEAYANECKVIWDRQASLVNDTIKYALICVIAALLTLIYLLCVCGKNKNGEYKSMWLDNIWLEIHIAAITGAGIGAVVICAVFLDDYFSGNYPYNLINMVIGLAATIASTVVITSLLSIIRNIKCNRFVESSIIIRIIRSVCRILIKIIKWIFRKLKSFIKVISYGLSRKTGIILISLLLVYTALIGGFGIGIILSPIWLVFGIILFGFASFVVAYRSKDIDEIKKGVSEVRNGNITYKIPELKCSDLKILSENINDIAKGLDESLSAKLKAERLKTELITNVSHDLKTPLTSIINYTELLSGVEGLPEEAKDYAGIIANKSDRLKNLTQDLFDISKVQSGNESVVLEKIDVSLLINQSLGEHDNEIQKSELTFCVNTVKDLYISADGRKMSRVISNLINNILKYTMKNTRVFISAYEKSDEIILEFKNIASYPMEFNAEEITGRFVRGDSSRTSDGNGLGLAIAKSYTEICNGKFEVIVDGDMFKTILKFKKYN